MSLAKPCCEANQMPMQPTTTAIATLMMAPPFKTHSESDTFENAMTVTIQVNASSMMSDVARLNWMPNAMFRMGGNMVASDAIQNG